MSILLGEHDHRIQTVLVSPRDDWAVATDWRGSVVLHDLVHAQPPKLLREEQPESDIACVDFDHAGQILFIHADWPAGRITRWHLESSSWMSPVREPSPSDEVGTIAAHPRRSRLAVAAREGISIWDHAQGDRLVHIPTRSNHRLLWLRSGEWLISTGADSETATVWADDEQQGLTWVRDLRPAGDMVSPIYLAPGLSENELFTGGCDSVITRWDAETGVEVARVEAHTRALGFEILAHHPRDSYLLSSPGLGELTLWDSENLEGLATVQFPCRSEEYGHRWYRGYGVNDSAAAFLYSGADALIAEEWNYDPHRERSVSARKR